MSGFAFAVFGKVPYGGIRFLSIYTNSLIKRVCKDRLLKPESPFANLHAGVSVVMVTGLPAIKLVFNICYFG